MTSFARQHRLQLTLFLGILVLFLAIWKGDGGYRDLGEYLSNAENMWLKGDLSKPGEPGKYFIHPLGIAFLSGPFVLAGAAIERISGGAIGHRSIAALSIPVFSALACLLLYETGRELRLSPLVSFWGAVMFGLATPLLSFTRLYFGEGGIALSICLANWAFLRARRASGRETFWWALLAGTGLAGATACHFNNIFISGLLWLAMAVSFYFSSRTESLSSRVNSIIAMTVIPILAGAALLYMNWRRFGSPLNTGYSTLLTNYNHPISVTNIPSNLQYLELWLIRVPWAIPALLLLKKLWPRERAWAIGLALAAITQVVFFLCYIGLPFFPIRYPQSAVILLSVGLLLLGEEFWRRWGARGLIYSALAMLLWNAGHFIRATDSSSTQTFSITPDNQSIRAYVWYMEPQGSGLTFGSPMGPLQWVILTILVLVGGTLLATGAREAARLSTEPI